MTQSSAADLSKLSAAPAFSRPKYSRENITVHMHKFHKDALRVLKLTPHDASPLDAALGLTECFFACKGDVTYIFRTTGLSLLRP
jgi:hypothetical protein